MTHNLKIQLPYFDGCPSWQSGLKNLHAALKANGLDKSVEPVQVMDNDDAARKRFLGSPSFRVNGLHIYRINVRSFLPIHLDIDKIFVHE
jgi:hypothetical protein